MLRRTNDGKCIFKQHVHFILMESVSQSTAMDDLDLVGSIVTATTPAMFLLQHQTS